ncbi:unnamed protein product [Phytophthora fragariaefolia]|uniref:Unnamed protein product n=1 Tax=Phytophthora fragariaefolia TaxID=1490495 RepID=A0A9W6YMM0_9STRA|nr:unnamed protein product [Phytophthora fragariaefolia]
MLKTLVCPGMAPCAKDMNSPSFSMLWSHQDEMHDSTNTIRYKKRDFKDLDTSIPSLNHAFALASNESEEANYIVSSGGASTTDYYSPLCVGWRWPEVSDRHCLDEELLLPNSTSPDSTASSAETAHSSSLSTASSLSLALPCRGRRLFTDWTYVKPDVPSNGVVGVNIFLSEEAVVTYVIKSGHLDVSDDSANGAIDSALDATSADNAGGRMNDIAVEEADVEIEDGLTVSQMDTSVQLSQRAVDALFGSPATSDANISVTNSRQRPVRLSHDAVISAFDLTPSVLRDGESQRDIIRRATQQVHISEAPAIESSDNENIPVRSSISRSEKPRRVKRDVNYLDSIEGENDYENLISEDSEDGDAADAADDDVVRPGQNEDDDCFFEVDAVLMDEAFIASLGRGDDDELSRAALCERRAALRAMEWSPVSSAFESSIEAYPGLAEEGARPVPELRSLCHSPILTFFYFVPKSLWVSLCDETNRYCNQQVAARAVRIRTKQCERSESTRETLKRIWRRLPMKPLYDTHELLHVIGLIIAHMLCPQQRRFAKPLVHD